jgi:general secretion pathway protein L
MKISGNRDSGSNLNQFKTLFSWWKSELAGMAPAFIGRKPGSVENQLLALFGDDAITFFWRDSSQWRELGRAHSDSSQPELAKRLNAIRNEKHITIARLPGTSVLQRRLDLPIAAESELRQILSYQLDSLSPYPPDQVYFSYRIQERDYAGKKLVVELSLAPKDEVDKLVDRLRSWDLVPEFVDFVD